MLALNLGVYAEEVILTEEQGGGGGGGGWLGKTGGVQISFWH